MPRGWELALVTIIGLTLLLRLSLYRLRDPGAVGYDYKHCIYEKPSEYLDHGDIYDNSSYQEGSDGEVHAQRDLSKPCDSFPNTDGVMLVMKAGATDAFDKMATQLLTSLQCLPDFLLFSDLEQKIGQYHISNVLENVDAKCKVQGPKEFQHYDAQISCPVLPKDCTCDIKGHWTFDKYTFFHMIKRAWEMRPGREWYIFAEADTYVFWSSIVYWLRNRANAMKDLYVGSVAVALSNNRRLAHDGSGYVIAGETVRKIVETIANLAAEYDAIAPHECCGDLLMSMAVTQTGLEVRQAHPVFNGQKLHTLPYGNDHWCEPLLAMYHMSPEEVSLAWQYEQTRRKNQIVQTKDIYQVFFAPHLVPYRMNWDNLSDDTCYIAPNTEDQTRAGDRKKSRHKTEDEKNAIERHAHLSAAACSKVCESAGLDFTNEEIEELHTEDERDAFIRSKYNLRVGDEKFHRDRQCFQWRYYNGVCCTAKTFKLGTPKPETSMDERWISGWFVNGINDWIEAKGDCSPDWKEPH